MMLYKVMAYSMSVDDAARILCAIKPSLSGSDMQVEDAVVVIVNTISKRGKGGSKRKKGKGGNNGLRKNGASKSSNPVSRLNSSSNGLLAEVVVPTPKGMTFNGETWVPSSRPGRTASSSAFAKIVAGSLNKGACNV